MTREKLAEKIHWKFIIWVVGIVNPFFMIPQLWSVWTTHNVSGISVLTLTILFLIQSGFSIHGFFLRDRPLMWSNAAAALVTAITALSVTYLR